MKLIKFSNGVMVNLENVSTVKIFDHRLVLNMNYCIIKRGNTIPDYVYIDDYTENDLNTINSEIGNLFIKANSNVLVNKSSIASVKINEDKVIINLAHPHSYNLVKKENTCNSIIAEYVYADLSVLDSL